MMSQLARELVKKTSAVERLATTSRWLIDLIVTEIRKGQLQTN
jgi:hypothetical protein